MKCMWVRTLLSGVILFSLLSLSSFAQGNFVYTNNDILTGNTVTGFSVASNGTLTQLPGSPFSTGGIGFNNGFLAANRITTSLAGNFLFVANTLTHDISVFSINPATGNPTLVPGSPFLFPIAGAYLGAGISLAATPDGKFLIAFDTGSGDVAVYNIDPMGLLTLVANSLVMTGRVLDGIKVSPDGKLLAIAVVGSPGGVLIFRIGTDGLLTQVPGSPFPTDPKGTGTVSVDINCESSLLFAAQGISSVEDFATIINVFSIDSTGVLTPIPGSPFSFATDSDATAVFLSPGGETLFVTNVFSNQVTALNVASNGGLTLAPGSPFGTGAMGPSGLATNQNGSFLYTANANSTSVSVLSIASSGVLTTVPGSPFSVGQPGGLKALAAFPPKSCLPPAEFDICIQDDSTRDVVRINITTGAYQLTRCRDGFTLSGTATVIKRGCTITLQGSSVDRRIISRIDTCSNRGSATVQYLTQGISFVLIDRNISNNTCACP